MDRPVIARRTTDSFNTPFSPGYHSMHIRSHSTATITSAETNSLTGISSASTLGSTHSTSPKIAESHPSPKINRYHQPTPSTTVYYHYNDEGKLLSTSTDESLEQGDHGHANLRYHVERGDKVGAFLAQRDKLAQQVMPYPAYALSEPYSHGTMYEDPTGAPPSVAYSGSPKMSIRHQYVENDSYYSPPQPALFPDYETTNGCVGFAARSDKSKPYPDPDEIRHLHTIHDVLPYIQPERRLNSLHGQTMDIVEQDTGTVFAYHVPKKLLVLFFGRKMVTKFIKTVEREDNENWKGNPTVQVLSIPRGVGSKVAFRILVSWMIRACQYSTMGQMRAIRVPQNTFAACTLAQILTLFGLHKDALRVDHAIAKGNFGRPIFPVELEALWNCLGEKNRYVCAAIKFVGQRLRIYEIGSTRQHRMWEDMIRLLDEYPPLNDRVRDLELNEKIQQTFGTEWCRNVGDGSNHEAPTYRPKSSGCYSQDVKSGSSVAPEQDIVFIQPEITQNKGRKAAILRIIA